MQLAEKGPFKPTRYAINSGRSLLRVNWDVDVYKPIYAEVARSERAEPLNRRDQVVSSFRRITNDRGVSLPNKLTPYWTERTEYNPLEVFGNLIQFVDYHGSELPKTTLPPQDDVKTYIDTIMARDGRATLPEQFETLLDITDNDLLGAVNIGYMASRIMARGLETRAYPDIPSGASEMFAWNEKIAQFDINNPSGKNDGPGDTYYFWTHMFGALYFDQFEGFGKKAFKKSFENGTEIMAKAREWVARNPVNAEHHEASHMGQEIASAILDELSSPRGVPVGRVEKYLQRHPRVTHTLDAVLPEKVKTEARKVIRREKFPLDMPFTKELAGVSADFLITNASDWHRIVQEDAEDSFPTELMDSINNGDVFLDVGSAQGLYAILAAKKCADVYAVDPDPVSIESVQSNLALNPDVSARVNTLNLGLSNMDGQLTLNFDPAGTYAPSLKQTTRELSTTATVDVRTIDGLIADGIMRAPDVIKIDVEGAEGMVIQGMQNLLSSDQRPKHLFVEIHDLYLPKFGSSSKEVLDDLIAAGYCPVGGQSKERGKKVYHFVPVKD